MQAGGPRLGAGGVAVLGHGPQVRGLCGGGSPCEGVSPGWKDWSAKKRESEKQDRGAWGQRRRRHGLDAPGRRAEAQR